MRPSISSEPNARTLLSAFGQAVTLQDGSVIEAIVRQRRAVTYNGTEAREVTHTVMSVAVVAMGTFGQGQAVTVAGERSYAPAVVDVGDGWVQAALSATTT